MRSYEWLRRAGADLRDNCKRLEGADPVDLLLHQIRCFVVANRTVLIEKKGEVRAIDFKKCEEDCPAARVCGAGRRKNGRKGK